MNQQSRLATLYRYMPVLEEDPSGNPVDPTGTTVSVAWLQTENDPVDTDWTPADWITDVSGKQPLYLIRSICGPFDTTAQAHGWYKIDAGTETVIGEAGVVDLY